MLVYRRVLIVGSGLSMYEAPNGSGKCLLILYVATWYDVAAAFAAGFQRLIFVRKCWWVAKSLQYSWADPCIWRIWNWEVPMKSPWPIDEGLVRCENHRSLNAAWRSSSITFDDIHKVDQFLVISITRRDFQQEKPWVFPIWIHRRELFGAVSILPMLGEFFGATKRVSAHESWVYWCSMKYLYD